MVILKVLIATALLAVMALLSGCGVSAEIYRIDERENTTKQANTPWKCLFTDCGRAS